MCMPLISKPIISYRPILGRTITRFQARRWKLIHPTTFVSCHWAHTMYRYIFSSDYGRIRWLHWLSASGFRSIVSLWRAHEAVHRCSSRRGIFGLFGLLWILHTSEHRETKFRWAQILASVQKAPDIGVLSTAANWRQSHKFIMGNLSPRESDHSITWPSWGNNHDSTHDYLRLDPLFIFAQVLIWPITIELWGLTNTLQPPPGEANSFWHWAKRS